MTKEQIETRIAELESGLKAYPNNPNRILIETDLRNLRTILEREDYV